MTSGPGPGEVSFRHRELHDIIGFGRNSHPGRSGGCEVPWRSWGKLVIKSEQEGILEGDETLGMRSLRLETGGGRRSKMIQGRCT